jgi:hypothetical protein
MACKSRLKGGCTVESPVQPIEKCVGLGDRPINNWPQVANLPHKRGETELCLSGERGTVTDHFQDSRLKQLLARLRRLLKREPELPEDPYAYVGAPKKPRLPHRSASAAVEPE